MRPPSERAVRFQLRCSTQEGMGDDEESQKGFQTLLEIGCLVEEWQVMFGETGHIATRLSALTRTGCSDRVMPGGGRNDKTIMLGQIKNDSKTETQM